MVQNNVAVAGVVKASRKSRKTVEQPASKTRAKGKSENVKMLALVFTIAMGIGIPGLTLALTTVAGRLACKGHYILTAAVIAVCLTVLAVSLDHLKTAIQDITRSGDLSSWLLAVAVDLSVVLSEAVQVCSPGVSDGLAMSVMVCVTIASMGLNVWAFLRHKN